MGDYVGGPDVRWSLKQLKSGAANQAVSDFSAQIPIYHLGDDGGPAIRKGETRIVTPATHSEFYVADDHTHRGPYSPTLSGLEMPFNAYAVPHILHTFFQGGTDTVKIKVLQSSGAALATFDKDDTVSAASIPSVLAVSKAFTRTAAEDHVLLGAVCNSWTLSGDTGGVITFAADFIGLDHDDDATVLPSTGVGTPANYGKEFALINFDGSGSLNAELGGIAVNLRSFSINGTNGARVFHYNAVAPSGITFARVIQVTGNLVIAFDPATATAPGYQSYMDDIAAGTDALFKLWNHGGSVSSAGNWEVTCNCQFTDDPEPTMGDGSYDITLNFQGVYVDATNPDIKFEMHDNVDDAW